MQSRKLNKGGKERSPRKTGAKKPISRRRMGGSTERSEPKEHPAGQPLVVPGEETVDIRSSETLDLTTRTKGGKVGSLERKDASIAGNAIEALRAVVARLGETVDPTNAEQELEMLLANYRAVCDPMRKRYQEVL